MSTPGQPSTGCLPPSVTPPGQEGTCLNRSSDQRGVSRPSRWTIHIEKLCPHGPTGLRRPHTGHASARRSAAAQADRAPGRLDSVRDLARHGPRAGQLNDQGSAHRGVHPRPSRRLTGGVETKPRFTRRRRARASSAARAPRAERVLSRLTCSVANPENIKIIPTANSPKAASQITAAGPIEMPAFPEASRSRSPAG